MMTQYIQPFLAIIILAIFFIITFLQSGLDKLKNKEGNIAWFKSQFENTVLKPIVLPLFWLIAIQEIVVSLYLIYALFRIFMGQYDTTELTWGFLATLVLLVQLFFGQRIAKDYVGASGIVPYIIVSFLAVIFCPMTSPFIKM